MALSKEQSLSKYGTEAYTAWGEAEAAADFKAKGGSANTPTPPPTSTPTPTLTTPSYTPTTSGEPRTAADLVALGFYGYAGWGNAEALADYKSTGGSGKGSKINSTLDSYQSGLFNASTAPETRVPTMEELKSELAPTTEKPAVLNRVEEYTKLRTEYGVVDLETKLNDLKAQEDEAIAALRIQTHTEEGKPVAMGVISGRVTEETRQAQENLDFIGRQKTRVTDELNTKYGVIKMFIDLKGLDYQDAVASYDKEFSQNLQLYDLVVGARKEARSEYEYDQTAAKANLAIYTNAITSGNLNYADLDDTQKTNISKLEVQAGLPVGFISKLEVSAGDKILGFSDDKTQAWVVGDDGNMKVIQTGLRASTGTGSDSKNTRAQFTEASTLSAGNRFPDLVNKFANTMTLEEIYSAYMNSEMGKKWGAPTENPVEIKLLYRIAKGEITPEDARLELEG